MPSRSWSWTSRRRGRRSCGSRPAASATPTCMRPRGPIRPAIRRACSGTKAPGWSRRSARAAAVSSRPATTSSRSSLRSAAECVHCRSPRTNRCTAIREQQGLGYLPDGTARLSRSREPIRHFMGTSTFAEYAVIPEIALAKVDPEAPPRRLRAVRLRALDRHRRGALHGQGRARLDLRRLRLRARRARLRDRLPAGGRRAHRLRSTCPRSASPRLVTTAPPTRASRPRTRSTGSGARPAASAPTTRSRRRATSP